jgi:hypothetical protein
MKCASTLAVSVLHCHRRAALLRQYLQAGRLADQTHSSQGAAVYTSALMCCLLVLLLLEFRAASHALHTSMILRLHVRDSNAMRGVIRGAYVHCFCYCSFADKLSNTKRLLPWASTATAKSS